MKIADWARRTAPTLTDEQWDERLQMAYRYRQYGPDRDVTENAMYSDGLIALSECRALLAELDRIAGDLTPRRLAYLQSAEECDSLYSYRFRGKIRTELLAAGIVYRLPPPGASCYAPTPLGRAVLRRLRGNVNGT